MILVDTSVWIDYFNGANNPHTDLLDASIVQGAVAIGDLIYLEYPSRHPQRQAIPSDQTKPTGAESV